MEAIFEEFGSQYVPEKYLKMSLETRRTLLKKYRILLEKKKIPENGWSDEEIEEFIRFVSTLDSNNFPNTCGVGEREGRIACSLVAKRHYNFSHGIGRSGNLFESQPKSAGSSLLSELTNSLILDYIKNISGIHSISKSLLIPVATGMALSLCFLSLKKEKPNATYILWSRIDQKSAFKAITSSGFKPIIIEPLKDSDGGLYTDLLKFENQIYNIGVENILCIYSTTSCFAPRNSDNLKELGILANKYNLFHVVNNAYGLQSSKICHQIEECNKYGRLDLFVQSTDKNFLVPVGGSIVGSFNENQVKLVAKTYAGRASFSQTLDMFMTLLSLGRANFKNLLREQKENFKLLNEELSKLAMRYNLILIPTKNTISVGMTLPKDISSELGSMLFTRGITGARVITCQEKQSIDGNEFNNWGSHYSFNNENIPYITAAASLGMKRNEIDTFIDKLNESLTIYLAKVMNRKLKIINE